MTVELALLDGGALAVSEKVFDSAFNEPLVHQAVTSYLTRGRSGTRAQKSRADVTGSGVKPWAQKGTGRSRAGSRQSPVWRGGGRTFAATPKNYAPKLNVKMLRGATRSILSELRRQGRLRVASDLSMSTNKTKNLKGFLGEHDMDSVLIVLDAENSSTQNFRLASRNLPAVSVIGVSAMNPVALLAHKTLLLAKPVIADLESWLS